MSTNYTYEMLSKMKGQAIKDIWHAMIGKPPGLRNTTGLKTSEDIIQAILKRQEELCGKPLKQAFLELEEESMPPKRKGNPIILPAPLTVSKKSILAVEGWDAPLKKIEVTQKKVRRLFLGSTQYFIEKETNKIYNGESHFPGQLLGLWNSESKTIEPYEEDS